MTTLDRAFIKAYSSDTHHRVSDHTHRLDTASLARQALAAVAPHTQLRSRASLMSETLATGVARPVDPLSPLSSFSPPATIDDSFHALLEVDRFAWPEECLEILSRSKPGWEGFARHLGDLIAGDTRCMALVSRQRGAGRTTIALAVARHMADRGLRTVVVDADFDNPRLAERCGVSARVGWGDVIESDLPFGEALITAVEDKVTLMPWRGSAGRLMHAPAATRAAEGFRLLREHYDLVVLDAVPLVDGAATAAFGRLLDATGPCATYLVCDRRSLSDELEADACASVARAGSTMSGIIHNFVPPANMLSR
jgi:Mrp family chromosome partitioning ATPase